jgi:hypothetical protein
LLRGLSPAGQGRIFGANAVDFYRLRWDDAAPIVRAANPA